MVKNKFLSIEEEENKENCGSIEFQVIRFTKRMEQLKSHFEFHPRDYLSERGLRKIMRKRERLLDYLSKKNPVRYKELVAQLNIQE